MQILQIVIVNKVLLRWWVSNSQLIKINHLSNLVFKYCMLSTICVINLDGLLQKISLLS